MDFICVPSLVLGSDVRTGRHTCVHGWRGGDVLSYRLGKVAMRPEAAVLSESALYKESERAP
jgi:hypothetical protein